MPFLKNRTLYYLLFFHALLWTSVAQLTKPNLDGVGDMLEAFAWGQQFFWGTFKHPPLSGWATHIWFSLFTTNTLSFYLFAYVMAMIGIIGILALAQLFLTYSAPTLTTSSKEYNLFMLLTLVFTLLSGGYSYDAAVYNADTILLPLWPWIIYTFLWYHYRCDRVTTKLLAIILFSLLAAAGMLAKYFTVMLLASLFIISLIDRNMRAEYKTIYPYMAMLLIAFFLLPHLLWQYKMHFPANQYMNTKFHNATDIKRLMSFLLSGITIMVMAWLAFAIFWWKQHMAVKHNPKKYPTVNLKIPTHLWLITLLPVGLTILISLLLPLHIRLKQHWAIAAWVGLPIVMAFLLMKYIHYLDKQLVIKLLRKIWLTVLLIALIMTIYYLYSGYGKYSMARQQMAEAIGAQFKTQFPKQTLSWAAGTWREPATLAFYLPNHPIALPGYPNQMPALVNPYPNWKKQHGVIVCYSHRFGNADKDNIGCINDTKAWLQKNKLAIKQQRIYYHPQGLLQYTKPLSKAVTVFWVVPHTEIRSHGQAAG